MTKSIISAAVLVLILAACDRADNLPDPRKTPGEVTAMPVEQICSTKWGHDRRMVSQSMKNNVFDKYGIPASARHDGHGKSLYEVDHLISRELGGADTENNLWPESYVGDCNAHDKDRLENALHREICASQSEEHLKRIQHAIATNWVVEYQNRWGSCKHS